MKKIIIVHSTMEIGGAETSLIGLLQSFDYSIYDVSLFLLNPIGELMPLIPQNVHILSNSLYRYLVLPLTEVLLHGHICILASRLFGKIQSKKYKSVGYMCKQISHRVAMHFLPKLSGHYDLALSFIDPHYIVAKKVDANVKLGWMHTDFSRVGIDVSADRQMWTEMTYIVNVSDACKQAFDTIHPSLNRKSIVIENIASASFIKSQADINDAIEIQPTEGVINLLSIGRFVYPKNFENIPEICHILKKQGLVAKWYLIGYGAGESEIRENAKLYNVEDSVIILGKKTNPYPYIKACDIYIQPSRYEGKSVAVREAQIIGKPVIITNYVTAGSQVDNGIDGIICSMDNEGIANSVIRLVNDEYMRQTIVNSQQSNLCKYTNENEVNKLYRLMA